MRASAARSSTSRGSPAGGPRFASRVSSATARSTAAVCSGGRRPTRSAAASRAKSVSSALAVGGPGPAAVENPEVGVVSPPGADLAYQRPGLVELLRGSHTSFGLGSDRPRQWSTGGGVTVYGDPEIAAGRPAEEGGWRLVPNEGARLEPTGARVSAAGGAYASTAQEVADSRLAAPARAVRSFDARLRDVSVGSVFGRRPLRGGR